MSGVSTPSLRLSRTTTRTAPPSRRNGFVELGPSARARGEGQQADALATVAEREDEQARAAVLPGDGVADHRALAVIDLGFLAGRRDDHGMRGGRARAAQLDDVTPHAGVARREAVLIDEVPPDRGVPAPAEGELDQLAVRLARARRRCAEGRGRPRRRFCVARRERSEVGGHLTGRLWWRPPTAGRANRDPGAPEIRARRLATDAGGVFNTAERPSQPPQCEDLLLPIFPQEIGHPGGEPRASPPRQCPEVALPHWPVLGVHRGRRP